MKRHPLLCYVVAIICLAFALPTQADDQAQPLPGTQPLTITDPLDEVMVSGISRFAVQAINDSQKLRDNAWAADPKKAEQSRKAMDDRRAQFRTIIGAVDERVSDDDFEIVTRLGGDGGVARVNGDAVTVYAVRWQVIDGVRGEGLLLVPKTPTIARIIALPDADWTPEQFAGFAPGLGKHYPLPTRLALSGAEVLVPTLISRDDTFSGNPAVAFTNQPHREFIYRQAFELGRHIIGYEVEKVLAAVDLLQKRNGEQKVKLPIGVAGVSEGGLLALYSAASDPRIDAVLVSGYFQDRSSVWQEPIYRNVWSQLTEFGDAEIAGMIAPRALVIEACAVPKVKGPPRVRTGRRGGAAPGAIKTCPIASVRAEFARAKRLYLNTASADNISLVESDNGDGPSGSDVAVTTFLEALGTKLAKLPALDKLPHLENAAAAAERQHRQVQELTDYTQRVLRSSSKVRDAFWAKADRSSLANWEKSAEHYRNYVWEEMIGKLPAPTISPNVRTRQIIDDAAFIGYEVVLDVYPDVIAAGILLLPKTMQADEKRPVVVCQHGLEGIPQDTLATTGEGYRYYKSFAVDLVKQGFIVYAPQNPYRGEDRFRVIQRQSNPLKRSLFSYIIRQHERTLEWLATLPNVDVKRIGFYGLSYGGKTAMRVPAILNKQYALSICSADFNDWIRKNASFDDNYSYVYTGEYEMPEWNMGHVASYAELASLISPRPFMVERGHDDGVAPDEWVAAEYARVRRHYDKLEIGYRTDIEFFNGPHTIHGVGTYEFLRKHLKWPRGQDRPTSISTSPSGRGPG